MLALLRQPLIKSVRIAQFGVKKFAQPNPRVLQRSCSSIFSVGVKKFAQPIPRVLQRSYGSHTNMVTIKSLGITIIFSPRAMTIYNYLTGTFYLFLSILLAINFYMMVKEG